MLRVGLTGGIASGKSTVARHLAAFGCYTIDADQLVSDLYQPGRGGHSALIDLYGEGILTSEGEIDRRKVADLAFVSSEAASRLNAVVHPLVLEECETLLAAEASRPDGRRIAVVEATLLLEAGGRARYEKIIVVDILPDLQIARAIRRGLSRADAERRIANQMARDERLRAADYVIENNGTEEELAAGTHRVYDDLLRIATARG